MFTMFNGVFDIQRKQAEYFVDVLPEGAFKTFSKNLVQVNTQAAQKVLELADFYVDGLKKSYHTK